MGTILEFEKLTKVQKDELLQDIQSLSDNLYLDGTLGAAEAVTSWQHLRLDNNSIFLHAECYFKLEQKTEKVNVQLKDLKRFRSESEYWLSVEKTRSEQL